MLRLKSISLLFLAAILLSACQLFEPLPTLPPVLTLPPVEAQATSGVMPTTQPSSTPESAAGESQLSPSATLLSAASTVTAGTTPQAILPASPTSPSATQPPASAPSATSRPTNRPAATSTRPAPTVASTASWHDVPLMPGAAGGKEDQGSYSYTVNASVADVQAFYDQNMPLTGWEPFASGEGETGNLLLMYQKDNITATIGLIDQGGNTLVLIVAE